MDYNRAGGGEGHMAGGKAELGLGVAMPACLRILE